MSFANFTGSSFRFPFIFTKMASEEEPMSVEREVEVTEDGSVSITVSGATEQKEQPSAVDPPCDTNIISVGGEKVEVVNLHPNDRGAVMVEVEEIEEVVEEVEVSASSCEAVRPAPKHSRLSGSICPVCHQYKSSHMIRHALGVHLPWFVRPGLSCFECCQPCLTFRQLQKFHKHTRYIEEAQRTNVWAYNVHAMLHFARLAFGLENLIQLWQMARTKKWYPSENVAFTQEELRFITRYEDIYSPDAKLDEVKHITVSPPSRVIALIHWRTLLNMLVDLNDGGHTAFRDLNPAVAAVDKGLVFKGQQ